MAASQLINRVVWLPGEALEDWKVFPLPLDRLSQKLSHSFHRISMANVLHLPGEQQRSADAVSAGPAFFRYCAVLSANCTPLSEILPFSSSLLLSHFRLSYPLLGLTYDLNCVWYSQHSRVPF